MTEWNALALIFAVATVVAFALMALVNSRAAEEAVSDEPARRWFGPLTPAVAGMVPSTASGRRELQQELWLAGYYQPAALGNFLSLRSLLVVVPLVAGLVLCLFADDLRTMMYVGIVALVAAVLGFAIPRVVLQREGKQRAEAIRRGIPMFMDTLGLCLSTGNGLPESFRRSGEAIVRGYPDMSKEARIVYRHAQLRSMDHALDHWRRRIPLPEVGSLVFLLSQSDRLGTDATKGLWELSTSYRVSSRQSAEASANKTNFWLLFPTVLCLLMAAALILVGPGFLQLANESRRVQNEIDKAASQKNDLQEMIDKASKNSKSRVIAPNYSGGVPVAPTIVGEPPAN